MVGVGVGGGVGGGGGGVLMSGSCSGRISISSRKADAVTHTPAMLAARITERISRVKNPRPSPDNHFQDVSPSIRSAASSLRNDAD